MHRVNSRRRIAGPIGSSGDSAYGRVANLFLADDCRYVPGPSGRSGILKSNLGLIDPLWLLFRCEIFPSNY